MGEGTQIVQIGSVKWLLRGLCTVTEEGGEKGQRASAPAGPSPRSGRELAAMATCSRSSCTSKHQKQETNVTFCGQIQLLGIAHVQGAPPYRGSDAMPWLSFFSLLDLRPRPEAMHPSFLLGDRVSVRQPLASDASAIPIYVRCKSGIVEEVCDPAARSAHTISDPGRAPRRQMYRVRFMAREVWPTSPGAAGDTLSLRISEDLLEPSMPDPSLDDAFIQARTMEPVAAPDRRQDRSTGVQDHGNRRVSR